MYLDESAIATKSLASILEGIVPESDSGGVQISGLRIDSRQITPRECFVAVPGENANGIEFLDDAIARGASAALVDANCLEPGDSENKPVPCLIVENLLEHLPLISNRFYDYPSRDITIVGVTGTNGKTSIASILAAAFKYRFGKSTYVGTLGIGHWPHLQPNLNTTPDLLTIQRQLAESRAKGSNHCTLEASSHGLAQGRLAGVEIDVAVFSNLSHEHLDYHGSMEAYAASKRLLFNKPVEHAVLNIDDEFGRRLCADIDSDIVRWPYGLEASKQHYDNLTTASDVNISLRGISMWVRTPVGEGVIRSALIGSFNVANLLAAIAAAAALGWSFDDIAEAIACSAVVPGRMEFINSNVDRGRDGDDSLPTVIVDYAHTPDGLAQSLESLRTLADGRLICVFGCGGDRDKDKRPMMGRVAENLADVVIVTSDNPRSESPQTIVEQILAGQKKPAASHIELSREKAIGFAIGQAGSGDVVLVAGKGHEDYQIVGAQKIPFSDRSLCRKLLQQIVAEAQT
ncbi:MAG: UDP-N-acetylmuramoyl-L-alanyl-D-glutamate--2,6-diaminopimelate ligase [Gammaproteobacteria bacterium]